MVQWLSICGPTQGRPVVWSRKIPYAVEQLSLWATTTEAHVPGACEPQWARPPLWEAYAPSREEPVHSNRKPAQPRINNWKINLLFRICVLSLWGVLSVTFFGDVFVRFGHLGFYVYIKWVWKWPLLYFPQESRHGAFPSSLVPSGSGRKASG